MAKDPERYYGLSDETLAKELGLEADMIEEAQAYKGPQTGHWFRFSDLDPSLLREAQNRIIALSRLDDE